jgi:hypothetical protein
MKMLSLLHFLFIIISGFGFNFDVSVCSFAFSYCFLSAQKKFSLLACWFSFTVSVRCIVFVIHGFGNLRIDPYDSCSVLLVSFDPMLLDVYCGPNLSSVGYVCLTSRDLFIILSFFPQRGIVIAESFLLLFIFTFL